MQLRGYDDEEIEATVKALDTGAPSTPARTVCWQACTSVHIASVHSIIFPSLSRVFRVVALRWRW
jgi:hypothetical protein